jgi:hypothetical protein
MTPDTRRILRSLSLCALVLAVVAMCIHPFLLFSVFIGAFILAATIGYPIFLLLRRFSIANAWTASLSGLAIGGGFKACSSSPLQYADLKGTSSRGSGADLVYTMIDGVPTQLMWNEYYASCAVFSVAGALAGWVFWNQISKPGGPAPTTK